MDKWRDPLKWLEMFNFALMPLGAIGLDHLLGSLDENAPGAKSARRRFLLFLGLVLMLLVVGLYPRFSSRIFFRRHFINQGLDGR